MEYSDQEQVRLPFPLGPNHEMRIYLRPSLPDIIARLQDSRSGSAFGINFDYIKCVRDKIIDQARQNDRAPCYCVDCINLALSFCPEDVIDYIKGLLETTPVIQMNYNMAWRYDRRESTYHRPHRHIANTSTAQQRDSIHPNLPRNFWGHLHNTRFLI